MIIHFCLFVYNTYNISNNNTLDDAYIYYKEKRDTYV